MLKTIKTLLLWLLIQSNTLYATESWQLSADSWASPRSAWSVTNMPEIKAMVLAWQKNSQSNIEVLYPGGEEGELWASELKDWLVALGLPNDKIILQTGSPSKSQIQINLVKPL